VCANISGRHPKTKHHNGDNGNVIGDAGSAIMFTGVYIFGVVAVVGADVVFVLVGLVEDEGRVRTRT